MLRPSPVLTPPPANSRSPTSFHYALAQSPTSVSSRSMAASADSFTTATRSSVGSSVASPRLGGSGPSAPRKRLPVPSRGFAPVSSTGAAEASSGPMSATASDSKHMSACLQYPDASYQPVKTAGTAAPQTTIASSDAYSNPATGTTLHGSSLAHASPSKRREKDIARSGMAEPAGGDGGDSTQSVKRARQDEQPPKVLPLRYELCPVDDMVELISHMLNELIATNDAIRTTSGGLTRFHSRAAPGISVRDYLHRLAKHATLIPPLLLSMVYYIDRLCAMYAEFTINTLTVHRFLITAATVAAKGLSDSFWNNTTYARVGGVRVAELKMLELEFLYRVDWKIVPNPEVLVAYYRGLVERTPGYAIEGDGADEMDHVDEENDG